MSYQDKEMDALIDAARKGGCRGDSAGYDKNVRGFIGKASMRSRASRCSSPT